MNEPGSDAPRVPGLLAAPGFRSSLDGSRGVVFLVGGYDGIGNFGDRVQLAEAAKLVARLGPGTLSVPVIELENRFNAQALRLEGPPGSKPHRALLMPRGGEDALGEPGDRLVAAELPASVLWTAVYLYGGGYLNAAWGPARLAMVAAAERLCTISGLRPPEIVSSGVQIDPGWLTEAGPAERATLRRLDVLRARDPVSAEASVDPGEPGPNVVLSADDAVGAFAGCSAPASERSGPPARVNVQVGAHPWATGDSDRLIAHLAGFLDRLAAEVSEPLEAQPWLAFEDSRTSERPALERLLTAEPPGRRTLVALEPLVLEPAELEAQVERLREADLTVCCSYHLALLSLMAGVPVAIVAANEHYAHKAEGLRRAFGLPAELVLAPGGDPSRAAEGLLELFADPGRRRALAGSIEAGRRDAIELRRRAEVDVLEALGVAFAGALGERIELLEEGGDEDGAVAPQAGAALERLAAVREDFAAALTERRRAAGELRAARERVAELERAREAAAAELEALRGSRSWRVTSPLRGGGAELRARARSALARVRRAEPD